MKRIILAGAALLGLTSVTAAQQQDYQHGAADVASGAILQTPFDTGLRRSVGTIQTPAPSIIESDAPQFSWNATTTPPRIAYVTPATMNIATAKGSIQISLETGQVKLPDGIALDEASRAFLAAIGSVVRRCVPSPR